MSVRVEQVLTEEQFEEFVALPVTLHGRGRHVPLLQPTLRSWWTGEHPQGRFGPVTFLLARSDSGAAVGRMCLHHNPSFDDKVGAETQLFGLTEFADVSVLDTLMTYAAGSARVTARTQLVGPVALLPNQTGGVITSGFDERGFMDSPWNPASYPEAYEALGFARIFEGATWIVPVGGGDGAASEPPAGEPPTGEPSGGVVVRKASRLRLRRDLEAMRQVLNASFAALPYYTEISAADLAHQTAGLEFLVDPDLFLLAYIDGEPAAFVLVVPDLSEFAMARDGRLAVKDYPGLLWRRLKGTTDAILIIKGTDPSAQGRGLQTLLARQVERGLRAGGYRTLRSTFVETANAGSSRTYERMGGRPLQGTTFYRRAVR